MNDVGNEGVSGAGSCGEMLVIGYGNVMRGDDGVGPAVAEEVSKLGLSGIRVEVRHQLTPELEGLLGRASAAVFVDAVDPEDGSSSAGGEGEAEEGGVRVRVRVRVRELSAVAVERAGWTGHRFDPEVLLALTRELRGRAPRAWSVEIPVREFGWGPGLTAGASEKVREAVAVVCRLRDEHACTRRD